MKNPLSSPNSNRTERVPGLLCTLLLLTASLLPNMTAVAQESDLTILQVTLLDADGEALAGTQIDLILIRYSDAGVEQIPTDTCQTDDEGQCTFEIVDAPRLASGYAEAYLDVAGIGKSLVSWSGNEAEIVLKGDEVILQATLSVPDETGYEYGTPETNTATATAKSPSKTPTASATATLKPSATRTPSATASPTILLPTPTPEASSGRIGVLPLACGLIVFTILGVLIWRKMRA